MSSALKSVEWIASSLDDLKSFSEDVQQAVGYTLYQAQCGEKHPNVKPFKSFKGASVLEVIQDFDGDTYRAVYTVKFEEVVYILHSFQKKSKRGIETAKQDVELIETRLKRAQEHYEQSYKKPNQRKKSMSEEIKVQSSSGNVFADLGLANPDKLLIKAELVRQISNSIDAKNLTQIEVAKLLDTDESEVSALLNGRLSNFSTEQLFRFLNALGSDVEIRVIAKSRSNFKAQTRIVSA